LPLLVPAELLVRQQEGRVSLPPGLTDMAPYRHLQSAAIFLRLWVLSPE
jgi:hypothetical protein